MLAQVQFQEKAYVSDQSANAKSSEIIQKQYFENFHHHMNEATPSQRIDVLIYLWGGHDTAEIKSVKYLIDQYVVSSITDDQESKASVMFSMALEITTEFSHYLALDFYQHRRLNSIISSSDDYESMGAQVRNLLEPLQTVSSQPNTIPDPLAHHIHPGPVGPNINLPGRIYPDAPQITPSNSQAEVERSATPGLVAEKTLPRPNTIKSSSRKQFATRFSEPAGPSIVKKLKTKLINAFNVVRDGFKSARKMVGNYAWLAKQSMRKSFAALKNVFQKRSQQFSESLMDAGVSTAEQLQGKTFARIKSSVGRAAKRLLAAGKRVLNGGRKFSETIRDTSVETREAFRGKTLARVNSAVGRAKERVVEGGKRVLRAAAFAGKLVAHGAARGVKAAVSFFDKAVNFVGNRIVALRGFNRV